MSNIAALYCPCKCPPSSSKPRTSHAPPSYTQKRVKTTTYLLTGEVDEGQKQQSDRGNEMFEDYATSKHI
eukprot:scaffold58831_cov40-Cyclotella_meneghiniana.AAC.2